MPMHYIPQYRNDDEEEEVSSKSSSLWSKDSKKKNRKDRKNKAQFGSVPPPPSTQQKAAKKLKNLMTRTFSKHQPAPPKVDEDAALLTSVINCPPYEYGASPASTATGQQSAYTHASRYDSAQQEWSRMQQQPHPQPSVSGSATEDYYSTASGRDYYHRTEGPVVPPPRHVPHHKPETRKSIEKLRNEAQDEIRAYMEFSVWQCLLAIVLYVVLSILCFSFVLEKEWTTLDSSYFAVVTFTTIGYGDVVPDTRMARIFTCFWAISGVACLGIALGVLGSNLIVVHEQEMGQADNERQSDMLHGLFDQYDTYDEYGNHLASAAPKSYSTVEEGRRRVMFDEIEDSDDENPKNHRRRRRKSNDSCWKRCCSCILSAKFCRSTFLFVYLAAILYAIMVIENWDASTTIYYGIITASTVGYGDFCPKSETGRLLATMFIPAAVCIMGFFLDFVANAIIDYRRQGYHAYLDNKPLTLEDIQILDGNGDGEVTRAEFLEFMLVAMDKVDKQLLEELKEHFNKLDSDSSGTINKDDLVFVTKERLTHDDQERLRRTEPSLRRVTAGTSTTMRPTTSTDTRSAMASNLRPLRLERDSTYPTSNRATANASTPQTVATEATYQNGGGRAFF